MSNVGRIWADEHREFVDPVSGKTVVRLTNYKGHSHSQYFTNNFWPAPDSFIFTSDREGRSNLFRYHMDDHRMEQLTDLDGDSTPAGVYCPKRQRFYFAYGPAFLELDPGTYALREVYRVPPDLEHAGLNAVTADARFLCTSVTARQDEPRQMRYNKSPDYIHNFKRKPETRIIRIDIDRGSAETLHVEHYTVQHVNASPTNPDVLTFCHEGPWARIDQRIWGLNPSTGRVWKIRSQEPRDAAIGHEYFFDDGQWIGYHGRRLPGEKLHFFGAARVDGSEHYEIDCSYHCTHFISRGHDLYVGDGTPANVQPWFSSNQKPYLMAFQKTDSGYDGPRVLAYHRATFNEQAQHPHASFTPDGNSLLYTSDIGGYANLYLVSVEGLTALPYVHEVSVEWTARSE